MGHIIEFPQVPGRTLPLRMLDLSLASVEVAALVTAALAYEEAFCKNVVAAQGMPLFDLAMAAVGFSRKIRRK